MRGQGGHLRAQHSWRQVQEGGDAAAANGQDVGFGFLSRATDGTDGTFGGDEWSAVGDDDDDDDDEEAALFEGGVHAREEVVARVV